MHTPKFSALCLIALLASAAAHAAVITVTTAADDLIPNDGTVSLREAIIAINNGNNLGDPDIIAQNPGTFGVNDTIKFNIPGTGLQVIDVNTGMFGQNGALPAILKPVLIDGYTQAGSHQNTTVAPPHDNAVLRIELNGAATAAGTNGLDLAGAGGITIRGLIVVRFSGNGIVVDSPNNAIAGNFIGTESAADNSGPGNGHYGILVNSGGATIGGGDPSGRNVIAFNGTGGIAIVEPTVVLEDNLINGKNNGSGIQILGGVTHK